MTKGNGCDEEREGNYAFKNLENGNICFSTLESLNDPFEGVGAYYANSHKGFCVGYKENDIRKVSDEILEINYSNKMCTINEFNEDTYKKLLSSKSADWSNEKECRALYILKEGDVSSLSADVYFNTESYRDEKMYIWDGYSRQC